MVMTYALSQELLSPTDKATIRKDDPPSHNNSSKTFISLQNNHTAAKYMKYILRDSLQVREINNMQQTMQPKHLSSPTISTTSIWAITPMAYTPPLRTISVRHLTS
jgi:tRNA U34 5-carboxymethylaminomethyl modifying enzyme MnmG/GidA